MMRPEFIVERNGKNFCLYAGLLDEAHQQGLKEIKTTLLQTPTNDNGQVAICQSEVRTEKGVFTGLGDASPQNVSRAMLTCLIRMAETRAKARALRDAVNVGVVALEELDSDGSGAEHEDASGPAAGHAAGRAPVRVAAISAAPEVYGADPPRRSAAPAARVAPSAGSEPRMTRPEPTPAPRPRPTAPVSGFDSVGVPPNSSDVMTPAQRRMLEALARQAGEQVELDGLTRREASQRITELKARLTPSRAA